jgi:TonB family protein
MSFSGTVLKQREKELKALKAFLMCSMFGSLTLHIVLFASGIGNIFARVPEIDEEPVEITFVDTPQEPEPEPTPPEKAEEKEVIKENPQIITSTNRDSNVRELKVDQSTTVVQAPVTPKPTTPVAKLPERTVEPLPTKQSFNNTTNNKVVPTPKQPATNDSTTSQENSTNLRESLAKIKDTRNTENSSQTTRSQISNSSVARQTQSSTAVNSNASTSEPGSDKLRGVLQGVRDSRNATGDNSQTPINPSTISRNNSSIPVPGNTTPQNSDSRQTKQPTVATAPTQPKIGADSNNGNGRAACRKCNVNYPEWARKRNVEGRVEVAVDTDSKGNVTNVRLIRSSGNEKLDREHLQRAQKWKLKPNDEGRQEVKISTEYAIRGSRRYQKLQERKNKQEAQASNSSTNNSSTQNYRRKRQLITSTSENIPTTSSTKAPEIRRRRRIIDSSQTVTNSRQFTNTSKSSSSQTRLMNRLQQRKNTSQTVNSSSNSTSSRRRRRILTKPESPSSSSSSSQNRLRNILLRHKEQSSENNQ